MAASFSFAMFINFPLHIGRRNYGCGAVFPEAVAGCKVLDLGSGAGIDCFVLSKLVGQSGRVVGVDMTQEQVSNSCLLAALWLQKLISWDFT